MTRADRWPDTDASCELTSYAERGIVRERDGWAYVRLTVGGIFARRADGSGELYRRTVGLTVWSPSDDPDALRVLDAHVAATAAGSPA
jgi:hypothetical protein